MRLNRKLNKVFDLTKILRTEVEFNLAADFMKMRQDFNKIMIST